MATSPTSRYNRHTIGALASLEAFLGGTLAVAAAVFLATPPSSGHSVVLLLSVASVLLATRFTPSKGHRHSKP
ncbi:hypothetical protein BU16DRAFT_527005 [Lophium mytilinum]|uniref:Uncharacterized protein n=1 Tax=Lophium mytilinum TaxID=390894 RepID=A0A6A6QSJ1_9PEZI|nr:hypothetical protein BU16DRAFT_527005 [Lophium mytilinum]